MEECKGFIQAVNVFDPLCPDLPGLVQHGTAPVADRQAKFRPVGLRTGP